MSQVVVYGVAFILRPLRIPPALIVRRSTLHSFRLVSSKDGTKVTTRIKKVSGNVDAFLLELRANLPDIQSSDIQHRVGGTIEVKGNYVRPVKLWLASLGF